MTMLYDTTVKKKPTNVSINADLLKLAKEYNINLSQTLEQSLEETIRQKKTAQWQEENKEALEHYNKRIAETGIFAQEYRRF